ncbi:hypothetical protein MPLB_300006 [Mesorhizobium sp. ORS 3324]|nr:hypothetical protein MPLB_300006 [Mesorhizobium sp. ORS 3324]
MSPVQFISRAELERRLAPYKCKCMAEFDVGFELWETGWRTPFTMTPKNGTYDEEDYRRLLAYVIAKTMPPGWRAANGG